MSILTVFDDRNRLQTENAALKERLALSAQIEPAVPIADDLLVVQLLNSRQEEMIVRLRAENKRLNNALEDRSGYVTGLLNTIQSWQDAAMRYWPPAWAFDASDPQTVLASLLNMARLDGVKLKRGKGAANFLYAMQLNLQARMHQIRGLQERLRNVRREYHRDRARLEAQISQLESVFTAQSRKESDNGLE